MVKTDDVLTMLWQCPIKHVPHMTRVLYLGLLNHFLTPPPSAKQCFNVFWGTLLPCNRNIVRKKLCESAQLEMLSSNMTYPFYSNTTYQLLLSLFRHFFSSRLVQMGVYNAELFTNLGLCCFFAQQYDMTLNCFERALSLASDENMGDVWYNIGHVAVVKYFIYIYFLCFR